MENTSESLRYPIGHFKSPSKIMPEHIVEWIKILKDLPTKVESLVKELSDEQLDTPYRSAGWTIRQVVHHLADSHHHSYSRFKWALTENQPTIKVYEEKEWSALIDASKGPIDLSLNYLKALHAKLVYLLHGLTSEQLSKSFVHPDGNIVVSVAENIGKYAWHGMHHYAHIEGLISREGWYPKPEKPIHTKGN